MTGSLSKEQVDVQYRAIGGIADPAAIMADFMERSRHFRETAPARLDLAYGLHPDERLDIFLPRSDVQGLAAVHIFIHGGYWYQFGKDEWSFIAEALTAAGAIVVIPRYSLCPTVGLDEIVQQMRTMLRWTWHNIGTFGGDPEQISVSGHSAGGHLAAMLLFTDWSRGHDLPTSPITGVTSISGLYDLRPLLDSYVQEHLRLSVEDAARLSPVLHVASRPSALLLAVAGGDPSGFHEQCDDFARRCNDVGYALDRMLLPDRDHLSILETLARPDGTLARAVLEQIAQSRR